jgi:dipeptidyl aminopeptidase/acylaminoacyl peptidase
VAAGIKDVARFYIQYELPATNSEELLHGMLVERMRKISLATRSKPFQLHNIDEWSGFFALQQITTPIILHHGTQDTVPYKWSVRLDCELKKLDRESTLFLYKGNDHELSLNNEHALAIERDVEFFKNHLR